MSFHARGAGALQEAFGGESDGRDPEARSELNYRHLAVVVVTAKLLPSCVLGGCAFVEPTVVSEHEDVRADGSVVGRAVGTGGQVMD